MTAYTGSVDQDRIGELEVEIGRLFEDADEMGVVLTYHAAKGDKAGRMDLIGRGIDQHLLGLIFAQALDHNAEHGCTS